MGKITNLDIAKEIIKYSFVDGLVLDNYVSVYAKKKVQKELKLIREKYPESKALQENEVIRTILAYQREGTRQKRYALLLMTNAFENKMISPSAYTRLRADFGITAVSPELEKALDTNHNKTKIDIYDVLQGNSSPQL